jgi:hypothetical protein
MRKIMGNKPQVSSAIIIHSPLQISWNDLLHQGQTVNVSIIRAKTGTFSIETLDVHLAPVCILADTHMGTSCRVVSYWSCKLLKLCKKNVLFVPDLLRFLAHCFTLIRCGSCVINRNFQTISASYKTRKPTFLVELENGQSLKS